MHFEDENGDLRITALFDGNYIGDIILDRVMFECRVVEDKVVVTGVREEDKEYFNRLKTKNLLEKVTEWVQDHDLFEDIDGNDVYLRPSCEETPPPEELRKVAELALLALKQLDE
jgi:hypothetical protein